MKYKILLFFIVFSFHASADLVIKKEIDLKGKVTLSLSQQWEEGEPVCYLIVQKGIKSIKQYLYDACGNMTITDFSGNKNLVRINAIHERGNSEAVIYINSNIDFLGYLKKYYTQDKLYSLSVIKKSQLPYMNYYLNEDDSIKLSILHGSLSRSSINFEKANTLFFENNFIKIVAQAELLDLNLCSSDSSAIFYCQVKNKVANLCLHHSTNNLSYRYGTSDKLDIELTDLIRNDSDFKYDFRRKDYTYSLKIFDNQLIVFKDNHAIFTSDCGNE